MHTTKINETIFTHNDGFYGDLTIKREDGTLLLPFQDVALFISVFVKDMKIARLEDADLDEIFGMPRKG